MRTFALRIRRGDQRWPNATAPARPPPRRARRASRATQARALRARPGVPDAPRAADPEWSSAAIDVARPQNDALGERAWWLYQLVRQVPLRWWCEHTGMDAAALLAWAAKLLAPIVSPLTPPTH